MIFENKHNHIVLAVIAGVIFTSGSSAFAHHNRTYPTPDTYFNIQIFPGVTKPYLPKGVHAYRDRHGHGHGHYKHDYRVKKPYWKKKRFIKNHRMKYRYHSPRHRYYRHYR